MNYRDNRHCTKHLNAFRSTRGTDWQLHTEKKTHWLVEVGGTILFCFFVAGMMFLSIGWRWS